MFVVLYSPTPYYVQCFTRLFCTFIGGKFGVSDWIRNHRITVSFA